MENEKIDIVMPWVDGGDPEWFNEKQKYTVKTSDDANINRYRDWGLLKYWFRGIEKYAPWVNKIHFITWGHLPPWLDTSNPKLHIVNHKDYIPEKYLPVFSSHPIELHMHRIEGLSDKFVYFNDDTYLINDISPECFFINGLPVDTVAEVPLLCFPGGVDHIIANNISIINKNFRKRDVLKKNRKQWFSLKSPVSTLKNIYMSAMKGGFSSFVNQHLPLAFLKSTLNEVWTKETEILESTSSHKFRNIEDVNQWVFRYWQFAKGEFVQAKGPAGKFFSIGKDDEAIKSAFDNQQYKMVCLSDDHVDTDFEKEQAFLFECFEKILPEKSSFEI